MSFICSALAAILEPGFSVQEALEMILADDEEEFESDLFIAPSEPSLVTDEDFGDEDSGGDFNNFNRNQLLADAELRPRVLTDRLPDTRRKQDYTIGDLMDGYNRFKKKKKLGTGSADPKNSKDKRHQQLLFLEAVSHHRSGGSNVLELEGIIENADIDQEHASERFKLQNENKANTEIQISDDEINDRGIEKPLEPETPNKRLNRINNDDKFFNLWKERAEKRQTLLKTIVKRIDDDVELFCSHISEVLRSLPPVNKAEAKKHLGIVLSNYEIMAARTTSSATSTNTVCSDIDILSSTPRSSCLSSYDLSVPYSSPSLEHVDGSPEFSIAEHHTSNAYSSFRTGSPQPTDLVFLESQEQIMDIPRKRQKTETSKDPDVWLKWFDELRDEENEDVTEDESDLGEVDQFCEIDRDSIID
ncbi:hypothetical protein RN001_013994 [Aquatica leii]|uniref:Uncharacterized protein n=1 Tax=Aquatica leii TaxID=1421715 RepID=A0AAN7SE94_9COLE|nr:hypothetical protein RN001_013994 [Aquatica leii]